MYKSDDIWYPLICTTSNQETCHHSHYNSTCFLNEISLSSWPDDEINTSDDAAVITIWIVQIDS